MTRVLMLRWVIEICNGYAVFCAKTQVTKVFRLAYAVVLFFNCSVGPGLVPLQECAIR